MKASVNGNEYVIVENLKSWTVKRKIGVLSYSVRIDKSAAVTLDDVVKILSGNGDEEGE